MAAECTAPLASAIFGLLGVGLGGIVGYASSVKIGSRNARHVAAAKFRGAFSPALAIVNTADLRASDKTGINVSKFLNDCFISHATAIEEFRPHISSERMPAYQKAWNQHCELEPTRLGGIAEFMAEGFNEDKPLKVIKIRLQNIVSCAET